MSTKFSFGSKKSTAGGSTKKPGGFSFGNKAASKTSSTKKGGFSFGKKTTGDEDSSSSSSSSSEKKPTGMSFGKKAESKDSGSSSTTKKSGGGFSFGGKKAESKDSSTTTTKKSGGGFSFGKKAEGKDSGSSSSSSSLSKKKSGGGFSFGGKKAEGKEEGGEEGGDKKTTTGFSKSKKSSLAPKKLKTRKPPPEHLKMTISEIIDQWTQRRQQDLEKFQEAATMVGQWDGEVRKNREGLEQLTHQVFRVQNNQKELERNIAAVEAYQSDLETELDRLVPMVEEKIRAVSTSLPSNADMEREALYNTAVRVNDELNTIEGTLNEVVERMNREAQVIQGEDEMSQILRTLNEHQQCLSWLQRQVQEMQHEV